MDKPKGKFRCRLCDRICDGSELIQDPMALGIRWTCADAFCEGPVERVRPEPQPVFGPLLCLLMSALAFASSLCGSEPKAPAPVTIARMASAKCGSRIPTHVTLTGVVESVKHEADGDYHVRLCEGRACVIVEIIPSLSADKIVEPKSRARRTKAVVRKGDLVQVTGISRWDSGHGWMEVHPAMSIKVLGLKPLTPAKGRRGNV